MSRRRSLQGRRPLARDKAVIATDQYRPIEWHLALSYGSAIQKIEDLVSKRLESPARGAPQTSSRSGSYRPRISRWRLFPWDRRPFIAKQVGSGIMTPPLVYQGLDNKEIRSI